MVFGRISRGGENVDAVPGRGWLAGRLWGFRWKFWSGTTVSKSVAPGESGENRLV